MLEGMIVMVITMIMLVWILAIGFIYYQKIPQGLHIILFLFRNLTDSNLPKTLP